MRKITWVDISILIMSFILIILLMCLMISDVKYQNEKAEKSAEKVETEEPERNDTPAIKSYNIELEPFETEESETSPAETALQTEEESSAVETTIEEETAPETPDILTSGYRYRDNVPLDDNLQRYIHATCLEYGVPEELIYALMENESQFTPTAKSSTDDYGICQINKCNHQRFTEQFGKIDWYNPYQNVLVGICMMSESLNLGDNVRCGLMVYHYGLEGAKKLWCQGIYTTDYAEIIIACADKYR